ncbi:MAG: hypothetical protein ACPF9D_05280 [Owenweeksia sp.]
MKHEIFERVEKLVSTLSAAEKDVLHKHIYSTLPEWQTESKLADLLNDLSHPESFDDASYSRKNYQMLEDRLLDSLLFDINLSRNGKYKEDSNVYLSLRKDGLKMRILQQRGLLHRAYQLAENVKQQAERSEDYDEIIEALNLQLSMIGLQQDATRFREITEQINHYEYCRFAKRKSLALLYELKMKKFHGMTENLDLFIKDSIQTIQRYTERIQCNTIDFVLGFFIKEDFEQENNWPEAHYYMTRLYEKASDLPHNTPHFNFWELVYEQARLCMKMDQWETGIFLFQKCIQNLPPEHLAHQKAVEATFNHYYRQKDYQEALKLATEYQDSRFYRLYLNDKNKHHWNFLKCCTAYQMGQRRQAKTFLDDTREFEKESINQALQVRFLRILMAIDSQNPDVADHYMDSMRKLVSRNQWLPVMKQHGLDAFYYALFKLRNCGYRFTEFHRSYPEIARAMKKTEQQLKREGKEPLISYWNWFKKGPAIKREKVASQKS